MGYELQARVVPPIEPTLLLTALKEKFVSLRWEIVRPKENFFSIAVAGRANIVWDEDFIVGVGRTMKQAAGHVGTLEPTATEPTETFIYLLDHLEANIEITEITRLIDDVINQAGANSVWEDL